MLLSFLTFKNCPESQKLIVQVWYFSLVTSKIGMRFASIVSSKVLLYSWLNQSLAAEFAAQKNVTNVYAIVLLTDTKLAAQLLS